MKRPSFLALVLTSLLAPASFAQPLQRVHTDDSVKIKNTIEEFYRWYAEQIKKKSKEIRPSFVRRKDGMTTLDFGAYRRALLANGFSDGFVERTTQAYGACLSSLGKIKYEDFLKFDGLDQYENIHCDFVNYYEWIRDQEPHDGAHLTSLQPISTVEIRGTVQFYTTTEGGTKDMWTDKQAKVIFRKEGPVWKIEDIRIEWP